MPKPKDNPPTGIISPAHLYTTEGIKRVVGWGQWAFAQHRRNGLRSKVCGKTVFVRGADLIAYVESCGKETET